MQTVAIGTQFHYAGGGGILPVGGPVGVEGGWTVANAGVRVSTGWKTAGVCDSDAPANSIHSLFRQPSVEVTYEFFCSLFRQPSVEVTYEFFCASPASGMPCDAGADTALSAFAPVVPTLGTLVASSSKWNVSSGTATQTRTYRFNSLAGISWGVANGTPIADVWPNWVGNQMRAPVAATPSARLREIIASRHAPAVVGRAANRNAGIRETEDFREVRARETLALLIGEDRYRRYLRDGFLTAVGASGKSYQIFPGSTFTRMRERGRPPRNLCAVLSGDFPPTDSAIVRLLLVLHDEEKFLAVAIDRGDVWNGETSRRAVDARPLPEIWRGLSRSAA